MRRDIIVIGGSAGSIDVLLELMASLPADLAAALFVVIHVPRDGHSMLPDILTRRGKLPASHPVHGEKIEVGRIYVAPGDNHLLVRPGVMEVVRGPRENGHRPSVDALFRSASTAYGARVIGVVLSGYQDCGTAGIMSIKARGGIGIAQAPETASAMDMPASAIEKAQVDHIVPPRELAGLLVRLVSSPLSQELMPTQPMDRLIGQLEGSIAGVHADLVCPACQGVLSEAQAGKFHQFRCHVGHTFSLEALVREQGESLERALWAAVRTMEESIALSKRLAATQTGEIGRRFAEKAKTQSQQVELIRQNLLSGGLLAPKDAAMLDKPMGRSDLTELANLADLAELADESQAP